jgi:hypothetical protein
LISDNVKHLKGIQTDITQEKLNAEAKNDQLAEDNLRREEDDARNLALKLKRDMPKDRQKMVLQEEKMIDFLSETEEKYEA